MSKLGINGFGRIGRLVLRRLLEVDSSTGSGGYQRPHFAKGAGLPVEA